MHELSLAQNALDIILDTASNNSFRQIVKVEFDIGQLSCVQKEALAFAMSSVLENTLAEGAELVMHEVSGQLRCHHCAHEFNAAEIYTLCPNCGKLGANIIAGRDTTLTSIEGL